MVAISPIINKPLKVLQASAGSGKTFSLTSHYLTLLFESDYKYREILAVTFTNKATEEMKSRILGVLRSLALADDKTPEFKKIILQAHPHLNEVSLKEKAAHIYRLILHDYSRFAVSTIDAFVQQVIRSFAFELGLDAGYRLEMNMEKVKQSLADKLNIKLDNDPDLLQWVIELALSRVKGDKSWNYRNALLGLAGEIFKERYQPFENAVKLHDAAALFKDLQLVTQKQLDYFETGIKDLAVHASQVFTQSGVLLDELKGKSRGPLCNLEKIVSGDFSKAEKIKILIDTPDEWQKGNLSAEVSVLYDKLNPALADVYNFYSTESPGYEMAKAVEANLYYLRLMQEMGGLLKDYRQENQVLLISDAQVLLTGITQDLGDNPSFIWEKMGNRYRHFLFDEFQDTSSFQWQNFLPLLKNAIAEANGKLIDNLIVGDVKQSIYRWRNGDWRILLKNASEDVGIENVLHGSLAENYRSAANIIGFNNFLFAKIPAILQSQINSQVIAEGGQEFFNSWWDKQGYDKVIIKAYKHSYQQKAPSTLAGGCIDVKFLPVDDNRHRPSQVKDDALKNMSQTLKTWITTGKYEADQVCVLVRSNTEAREVIQQLMRNNIPCLSGEALLIANNSAVKLLVSTLYLMITGNEEAGIFKTTCIQLYHNLHNKRVDPEIFLQVNFTAVTGLKGYLPDEFCDNFLSWMALPVSELAQQLIGAYGLDKLPGHLPYLIAFGDMVSEFTAQGERGITRFLEWWEDEGRTKALPSAGQTDAVQVMTIHKSKGLAFDVVMLPFCSWDLEGMPNSIFWVNTADTPYAMLNTAPVNYKKSLGKSTAAPAYFEELLFNYMDALNMLYVATTRTRMHLYITAPGFAKDKDEKPCVAGDLIFQALKDPLPGFETAFDGEQLVIDEAVSKRNVVFIAQNPLEFKSYPLSNRLNKALISNRVWDRLDLLSGNSARRRGIILHDLLSRITHPAELETAVKQMQQEGLFRAAEAVEIKELAVSVLNHPQLKALLDKPYQSLNEQTILNNKGESYRPDKVLIGADELVIIDFKFTGEPKPEHKTQVNEYKILLNEMGYTTVNGWLYYGYLQQLIAV